jgi:hypothetical protein
MNGPVHVHYTYQPFDVDGDLRQGDILESTTAIQSILQEVHPHFLDSNKYIGFLVLTQTCDLTRRKGADCKSRYINLAVIRPLEHVLWNFLDRICDRVKIGEMFVEGSYLSESKNKAHELLERIINQNEQALGVFYLHPDGAVNIAVHSVALLQVSIALRSHEHYDTLVAARCGRLEDSFRDKLGWLLGNLFSRVATEDLSKERQKEIKNLFLNGEDNDSAPFWITRKKVELANKNNLNIEGFSRDEIHSRLQQFIPEEPKEVAIEKAIQIVQEVVGTLPDKDVSKIKERLKQDPFFSNACRQ